MSARPALPSGMAPRLLGREAAAAYLGISPNHFDDHVAPALKAIPIGRRVLYDVRALDRWVDAQDAPRNPLASVDDWLGRLDGDPVGRR